MYVCICVLWLNGREIRPEIVGDADVMKGLTWLLDCCPDLSLNGAFETLHNLREK